jgi:K+-transporting ATPase ATPase C chain
MKDALRTSFVMLVILTVLTGVVYPLIVTAVAQVVFPGQANGSLVVRDGKPVGSSLVGQPFTRPGYFWGRPSATSPTPYNAAASSGSNLGPLNPALEANVRARIEELRAGDPSIGRLPVDLVTASGSGLDPHISPAAAEVQVPRVAKARGKSEDEIRRLVARHTEGRQLGLLGEPRVNVLLLNLALDGKTPEASKREPPAPVVLTRWPRP